MKKLLFFFAVALSSLLLHAQTNQVVWLNGKVYYEQPIAAIDSITYDMSNMITGDTLKLILPRATQQIVYRDVIKEVHDTIIKEIHDTVYIYEHYVLAGAFSVSADKQVAFSRGNLQYRQSTKTWSFAENQYDMLGTANVTDGTESYQADYGYSKSGTALTDKIDLFCWSANNTTAKWGISTSQNIDDYAGDFVDWGTNTISMNAPNTYRTLTNDEWNYLLNTRTNASEKKGVARIQLSDTEYANGLILLPDRWICPEGVTFKSGFASANTVQAYADYQTFTLAEWQQLEAAGAVFLPATGFRFGSELYFVQYQGYYWSASVQDPTAAYEPYFASVGAPAGILLRYYAIAVRLVKDL